MCRSFNFFIFFLGLFFFFNHVHKCQSNPIQYFFAIWKCTKDYVKCHVWFWNKRTNSCVSWNIFVFFLIVVWSLCSAFVLFLFVFFVFFYPFDWDFFTKKKTKTDPCGKTHVTVLLEPNKRSLSNSSLKVNTHPHTTHLNSNLTFIKYQIKGGKLRQNVFFVFWFTGKSFSFKSSITRYFSAQFLEREMKPGSNV